MFLRRERASELAGGGALHFHSLVPVHNSEGLCAAKMTMRMESIEDIISEMRRLQASLPARPSPEEVQIAEQTLARVDAALATRLEELFSQTRPAAVPNPVFRAFQEMREDVLRSEVCFCVCCSSAVTFSPPQMPFLTS